MYISGGGGLSTVGILAQDQSASDLQQTSQSAGASWPALDFAPAPQRLASAGTKAPHQVVGDASAFTLGVSALVRDPRCDGALS